VYDTKQGLEGTRVVPEAKGRQGCVLCRVSRAKTYDFVCLKQFGGLQAVKVKFSLKIASIFTVLCCPICVNFNIFLSSCSQC